MCTNASQRNRKHKSCTQQNTSIFHETNQRLQDAIKTKGMGEMTVVERLLDVAYPNIEASRKKKELVDTKRRRVTYIFW